MARVPLLDHDLQPVDLPLRRRGPGHDRIGQRGERRERPRAGPVARPAQRDAGAVDRRETRGVELGLDPRVVAHQRVAVRVQRNGVGTGVQRVAGRTPAPHLALAGMEREGLDRHHADAVGKQQPQRPRAGREGEIERGRVAVGGNEAVRHPHERKHPAIRRVQQAHRHPLATRLHRRRRRFVHQARRRPHQPLVGLVARARSQRLAQRRRQGLDARPEFAGIGSHLGRVPCTNGETGVAQRRRERAPGVEAQVGRVEQALAAVLEAIVEQSGDHRGVRDIGDRQQQLATRRQQRPQPRQQPDAIPQVLEHVGADDEVVARKVCAPVPALTGRVAQRVLPAFRIEVGDHDASCKRPGGVRGFGVDLDHVDGAAAAAHPLGEVPGGSAELEHRRAGRQPPRKARERIPAVRVEAALVDHWRGPLPDAGAHAGSRRRRCSGDGRRRARRGVGTGRDGSRGRRGVGADRSVAAADAVSSPAGAVAAGDVVSAPIALPPRTANAGSKCQKCHAPGAASIAPPKVVAMPPTSASASRTASTWRRPSFRQRAQRSMTSASAARAQSTSPGGQNTGWPNSSALAAVALPGATGTSINP